MGLCIESPGVIRGGEVCVWTKGQYEVSSSITLYLTLLPHLNPRPGALELMDSLRLTSLQAPRIPSLSSPSARHADVSSFFMGAEHLNLRGKQFTNSPSSFCEQSPSPYHIGLCVYLRGFISGPKGHLPCSVWKNSAEQKVGSCK